MNAVLLSAVISGVFGAELPDTSWDSSYASALDAARKAGRPLLLVLHNPKDKKQSFPQLEYNNDKLQADLLRPFQLCAVDVSTDYGKAVAKRYRAAEFPYLAITDSRVKVLTFTSTGQLKSHEWAGALVRYRMAPAPPKPTPATDEEKPPAVARKQPKPSQSKPQTKTKTPQTNPSAGQQTSAPRPEPKPQPSATQQAPKTNSTQLKPLASQQSKTAARPQEKPQASKLARLPSRDPGLPLVPELSTRPKWEADYRTALSGARNGNRPLLVVFDDPKNPKQAFQQATYTAASKDGEEKKESAGLANKDQSGNQLLSPYQLCRIDVSTDYGKKIASLYQVSSYPYVAITDHGAKHILYSKTGQFSSAQWASTLTTFRARRNLFRRLSSKNSTFCPT